MSKLDINKNYSVLGKVESAKLLVVNYLKQLAYEHSLRGIAKARSSNL